MAHSIKTVFSVDIKCESCVEDINKQLRQVAGVQKTEHDLKQRTFSIEGNAAPSELQAAFKRAGKNAILRGSGMPDKSAVCILRRHKGSGEQSSVYGLVRLVQSSDTTTIVDVGTHGGLAKGRYHLSVRNAGDISRGPASLGSVWGAKATSQGATYSSNESKAKGMLGEVSVGHDGQGSTLLHCPVVVSDLVGRGILLSTRASGAVGTEDEPNALVGVIARSAGIWENTKTVCSCTGKTEWEERETQQADGML